MANSEAMQPVTVKVPREVIEAYTRHAGELGTSRNGLFLEGLRAYLMTLDAGCRTLPDVLLAAGVERVRRGA